jgi:hypothetical protein
MTWCDKLASTPSAGFKLEPHHMGLDAALRLLGPMIDKWVERDKQLFQIVQTDPFSFDFQHHDGFTYGIAPLKLSVDFKYRMRAKHVSAGPPTVELTTAPKPYSELLPEACNKLVKIGSLLLSDHPRPINRVGVTTTTIIDIEEAPPGIARFLEYLGRPWDAESEEFNLSLIAPLATGRGYKDRCIHMLSRGQGTDKLLTMQFDWQRIFTTPREATTAEALTAILNDAQEAGVTYFEDIAEGNRFDEKLIAAAEA